MLCVIVSCFSGRLLAALTALRCTVCCVPKTGRCGQRQRRFSLYRGALSFRSNGRKRDE